MLARDLLAARSLWDPADVRPFVVGSRWGSGGLATLFARSGGITNEGDLIEKTIAEIRLWPAAQEANAKIVEAA
jgi:hypothetical protein